VGAPAPGLLILVPARGGSKGLPGKNVRPLGGLPLLAWTARAIAASGVAARAVLSTDDPAIAEVGRAHGLEVPFLRPAALATDTAGSFEVVEHALEWLARESGYRPHAVMLLQPTCPFRRPERLREAMVLLGEHGTEGVIAMRRIERPLSVMYRERTDGLLEPLAPWDERLRRQDVRSLLTPSGSLYLLTTAALAEHRRLFPPCLRPLPSSTIEDIDIDTAEDWALAEAVVAAGLARP